MRRERQRQAELKELGDSLADLNPFFYVMFHNSSHSFSTEIPSAMFRLKGTAGHFLFNPNFWDKLNTLERLFLVMHECNHGVLQHFSRFGDSLNDRTTQLAIDVANNASLLRQYNFRLEDLPYLRAYGVWADKIFNRPPDDGLSAEEYLFLLQRKKANDSKKDKDSDDVSNEGDSEDGDSEDGDSEDGDSEDGDSESGDSENGDSESGDSENGDSEGGTGGGKAKMLDEHSSDMSDYAKHTADRLTNAKARASLALSISKLSNAKAEDIDAQLRQQTDEFKRNHGTDADLIKSIRSSPISWADFARNLRKTAGYSQEQNWLPNRRLGEILDSPEYVFPTDNFVEDEELPSALVYLDVSYSCDALRPAFKGLMEGLAPFFDSKLFIFGDRVIEFSGSFSAGFGTNINRVVLSANALQKARYVIVITDLKFTLSEGVTPISPEKYLFIAPTLIRKPRGFEKSKYYKMDRFF